MMLIDLLSFAKTPSPAAAKPAADGEETDFIAVFLGDGAADGDTANAQIALNETATVPLADENEAAFVEGEGAETTEEFDGESDDIDWNAVDLTSEKDVVAATDEKPVAKRQDIPHFFWPKQEEGTPMAVVDSPEAKAALVPTPLGDLPTSHVDTEVDEPESVEMHRQTANQGVDAGLVRDEKPWPKAADAPAEVPLGADTTAAVRDSTPSFRTEPQNPARAQVVDKAQLSLPSDMPRTQKTEATKVDPTKPTPPTQATPVADRSSGETALGVRVETPVASQKITAQSVVEAKPSPAALGLKTKTAPSDQVDRPKFLDAPRMLKPIAEVFDQQPSVIKPKKHTEGQRVAMRAVPDKIASPTDKMDAARILPTTDHKRISLSSGVEVATVRASEVQSTKVDGESFPLEQMTPRPGKVDDSLMAARMSLKALQASAQTNIKPNKTEVSGSPDIRMNAEVGDAKGMPVEGRAVIPPPPKPKRGEFISQASPAPRDELSHRQTATPEKIVAEVQSSKPLERAETPQQPSEIRPADVKKPDSHLPEQVSTAPSKTEQKVDHAVRVTAAREVQTPGETPRRAPLEEVSTTFSKTAEPTRSDDAAVRPEPAAQPSVAGQPADRYVRPVAPAADIQSSEKQPLEPAPKVSEQAETRTEPVQTRQRVIHVNDKILPGKTPQVAQPVRVVQKIDQGDHVFDNDRAADVDTEAESNAPDKPTQRVVFQPQPTVAVADATQVKPATVATDNPAAVPFTEELAPVSGPGTTFDPATASLSSRDIVHRPEVQHRAIEQVAQAMRLAPDKPVEITLSPEELGKVRMNLSVTDQAVTMHIVADRPETLDLLRRNIEILAQEYRAMGFENLSFAFSSGAGGGDSAPDDKGGQQASSAPTAHTPAEETQPSRQPIGGADGVDIRL